MFSYKTKLYFIVDIYYKNFNVICEPSNVNFNQLFVDLK